MISALNKHILFPCVTLSDIYVQNDITTATSCFLLLYVKHFLTVFKGAVWAKLFYEEYFAYIQPHCSPVSGKTHS